MGAMPRVTAILVVHDGDRWLDRTLAALASQTRRPDALVVVAEPTTNFTPEELEVELLAQVDLGETVRRPGSDVKKGETVLEAGDVITAVGGELGTLAFVNAPSVSLSSSKRRLMAEQLLHRLRYGVVRSWPSCRRVTSSSTSASRPVANLSRRAHSLVSPTRTASPFSTFSDQ